MAPKYFPALSALCCALSMMLSLPVLAQSHEDTPMWGKPQFDDPADIEEPEPWTEGEVTLPEYPQDGDLVKMTIASRGNRFTTYIDAKTLQIGEDGVVRYVVVIRSDRGVDNVLAEGLRGGTREYREYGYGTNNKFEPVDRPWRMIRATPGPFGYRVAMSDDFACQYSRRPYDRDTLLQRIKWPTNVGGGDDFLDDRNY
jgi:hypothetical protein